MVWNQGIARSGVSSSVPFLLCHHGPLCSPQPLNFHPAVAITYLSISVFKVRFVCVCKSSNETLESLLHVSSSLKYWCRLLRVDNTPCRAEDLRPNFTLPCKLVNCLYLHEIQMLKQFILSWPGYKQLHKWQNVRASEAWSPTSKEMLWAEPHHLPTCVQEPRVTASA